MRTFKRAFKRADDKVCDARYACEKSQERFEVAKGNHQYAWWRYLDILGFHARGQATKEEVDAALKSVLTTNEEVSEKRRSNESAVGYYNSCWCRHFWIKRALESMERHLQRDEKRRLGVRAMMAQRLRARHAAALPGGFRHAAALRRGGSAA